MAKQRIAYVTSHFPPQVGGVETHVSHLATEVAAIGWETEVLVPQPLTGAAPLERIEGVLVRRFTLTLRSRAYPVSYELLRFLRAQDTHYDVVHAHNYHGLPALMAALSGHRPLVFTPHYHGTGHSHIARVLHYPYRPLGRILFARADAVIAVSAAEAALVVRDFPGVEEKIAVIGNGVETDAIVAADPFEVPGRILLSVGRLENYKGVDRALAALSVLPADFALQVVGDGPAKDSLVRLADELGLSARVTFAGHLPEGEVHRWLRTADVLISMSERESFGITLAEAAVSGAGVVASDIPAHRELASHVGDGRIRLVPRDGGLDRIAAAVLAAADDVRTPALRAALSWREVAERSVAIYRRLCGIGP